MKLSTLLVLACAVIAASAATYHVYPEEEAVHVRTKRSPILGKALLGAGILGAGALGAGAIGAGVLGAGVLGAGVLGAGIAKGAVIGGIAGRAIGYVNCHIFYFYFRILCCTKEH